MQGPPIQLDPSAQGVFLASPFRFNSIPLSLSSNMQKASNSMMRGASLATRALASVRAPARGYHQVRTTDRTRPPWTTWCEGGVLSAVCLQLLGLEVEFESIRKMLVRAVDKEYSKWHNA